MTNRAALICLRAGHPPSVMTFWADRAQAEAAEAELTPCDEDGKCVMAHLIVESVGAEHFRVTTPGKETT